MSASDQTAAAERLMEAGRWLDARGYSPATSGNYSHRIDEERILVTASGRHKGRLGPGDFVVIDRRGRTIGEGNPSAETSLHALMFRLVPGLGAVLHTHSVASTVLTLTRPADSELALSGYEMLKALPGVTRHDVDVRIPIFENTQDMAALAERVCMRWASEPFPAYLVRGHGLYAWGVDVDAATRATEGLEFLVACELEKQKLRVGPTGAPPPRGTGS